MRPASSPAMALKGLNVEPGAYWPWMAQLFSGVLFSSAVSSAHSMSLMPSTKSAGLNVGNDASVMSPPVVLVDLLDAVLGDLVVEGVRLRRSGLGLELVVDDLARVAEHVRGQLPVGVATHRHALGGDTGELLGVLVDPDLQLFRHVARDGDGHVGAVALVGQVSLEVGDGLRLAGPGERVGEL